MVDGQSFVDYAKVTVAAGDGGRGCLSFRREKFVPRGGPDGGDGGRGGHVYLEADPHMATLLEFRYRPHYRAGRGQHGMGSQCTGRDGDDLVIKVPIGTVVYDSEGNWLADLLMPGHQVRVARGGDGGRGNQHFATPTNRTPTRVEDGWPGEEKQLILELKAIADVGLVGLPNAGKSTLLAALTRAEPKIASYPFTTLSPNLGVFEYPDLKRVVIADIPGLIEGAHHGAGLGDRFLRHIERTRLLVYLVADFEQKLDPAELRYQFDLVQNELRSYKVSLVEKPFIICLSRSDEWRTELGTELAAEHAERTRRSFENTGARAVVFISSHDGTGLRTLMEQVRLFFEHSEDGWQGNLQYIQPLFVGPDPHRSEAITGRNEQHSTADENAEVTEQIGLARADSHDNETKPLIIRMEPEARPSSSSLEEEEGEMEVFYVFEAPDSSHPKRPKRKRRN